MNEARIQFEGNLGADPELKTFTNSVVAEFSVAVTKRQKKGDTWETVNTTWYRVGAWGKLADAVMELKKGQRVFVSGGLIQESWEKDGKSFSALKVFAEGVYTGFNFAPVKKAKEGSGDPWATTSNDEPPF